MDTKPQYIDPELTILLIMAADNLLKWDKQEISLDALDSCFSMYATSRNLFHLLCLIYKLSD